MDFSNMYGMQPSPFGFRPTGQSPYAQYAASFNQAIGRQPENNVLRVNGIGGVEAYQLPPRSSVVMFDENSDVFYMKTTDDGGFPSVRTFAFSEVTGQHPQSDYVTRHEFTSALNQLKEAIAGAQQPIQQPAAAAEQHAAADAGGDADA